MFGFPTSRQQPPGVYPAGLPPGSPGSTQVNYPPLVRGTAFDGVNDLAEVTGLSLPAPADFTVLGWFRTTNLTGQPTLFCTTPSTFTNGLQLRRSPTGIELLCFGPTGTAMSVGFTAGLVAGVDYHLALSVSAFTASVFLNGLQLGAPVAIAAAARPTGVSLLRFGAAVNTEYFNGRLFGWAVFGRALTADEVLAAFRRRNVPAQLAGALAHYPLDQLGPGAAQSPDLSGNGRHLTLINMPANPIVTL